jgi:DNA-directed RNA polymerase subunit RPC12/RpoP
MQMKPKPIRCWYCNSKHVVSSVDPMYYRCTNCGKLFPTISKEQHTELTKLLRHVE